MRTFYINQKCSECSNVTQFSINESDKVQREWILSSYIYDQAQGQVMPIFHFGQYANQNSVEDLSTEQIETLLNKQFEKCPDCTNYEMQCQAIDEAYRFEMQQVF